MIAVVDYGAGNLRSVCNALESFEQVYQIAKTPGDLDRVDGILLPGVGHFAQMLHSLRESGMAERLVHEAHGKMTPLLGICLGMQALFEASEEAPGVEGLGLFSGEVVRFQDVRRIPHMGWNDVDSDDRPTQAYYFANSFYAPICEWTTGICSYHLVDFTAILLDENVAGFQFHPEKSGEAGLELLREWCESC